MIILCPICYEVMGEMRGEYHCYGKSADIPHSFMTIDSNTYKKIIYSNVLENQDNMTPLEPAVLKLRMAEARIKALTKTVERLKEKLVCTQS